MSVSEILQELHRLSPEELAQVEREMERLQIDKLILSPLQQQAVAEGELSAQKEGWIPAEQLSQEMQTWDFRSS